MTVRRAFQLGAAAAVVALAAAGVTELAIRAADSGHGVAVARAPSPTSSPTSGELPPGSGAEAAIDVPLPHPRASLPLPSPRRAAHHRGLAPDSVAIPGQGVVAPVGLCAMASGALEPPADVARTCRWAGGAELGDATGTVALTGHINWVGQGTGAFGRLAELHRGDTVLTTDDHGRVTRWRVSSVEFRSKSRGVDLAAFAGPGGPRVLYLISCGGPFDAAEASYLDNIYVRATPAS